MDEISRKNIYEKTGNQIKYLHKKGSGLTPVLFVRDFGVMSHKNIDELIRDILYREGIIVCEGWKSALTLCVKIFNSLCIFECQGTNALIKFLDENNIVKESISAIFTDTDVLCN